METCSGFALQLSKANPLFFNTKGKPWAYKYYEN